MIIEARPRSLFNFEFDVLADDRPIGSFRHKVARRSVAVVHSVPFEILRQGFFKWELTPEGGGLPSVSVDRAPKGRYDISWTGGRIALIRSFLGFRWSLAQQDGPAGWVRLNNLFSRSLTAEVPDDLPDEAAVMLLWTVVMLRRKAASAAAGGGGAG